MLDHYTFTLLPFLCYNKPIKGRHLGSKQPRMEKFFMSDFMIITDSCCDLPSKLAQELELTVLPLSVNINGKEYFNYLDGSDIKFEEFYRILRQGATCSTSAVNTEAFTNKMEPILEQEKDILYISFSSALSTTYNSAQIAANELSAKYPNRKIYVIDSLSASLGQGMLVYYAVQQKQSGKSIDEVKDWIEHNKLQLCHWFTVDDLNHLKRGGRVSTATALVGSILGIKPILHVDDTGRLINVGKVKGRKASLSELVDHLEDTATHISEQTIFISHGDCEEDAELLSKMIRKRMRVKNVIINFVGPVIGAHSGPGTMALFFFGTKR